MSSIVHSTHGMLRDREQESSERARVLTMNKTVVARLLGLLLLATLLAGCDKCGNRVKFNAPSIPNACGDNADPAR